MGNRYRQDCNLAMAYMHVRLDELVHENITNGFDLVQTIGVINSHGDKNENLAIYNNAVSKVSGAAFFSHEIRGADANEVAAYYRQAEILIHNTAAEFGINARIETFSDQSGIGTLNENIQQQITDACDDLKLSHAHMPSGAWHDAAVVAGQQRRNGSAIPVGMIFIPCRSGISHSPDEYASSQQIADGASVLATTLLQLASRNIQAD